jgi:DNA-binding NtrC family response regulator
MQASSTTALILEDEPRFRALLSTVLQGMNIRSVSAPTAADADRLLASQRADLLLLDLNLPVTGGLEFLESFRRTHPTTPAIIITGFGDLPAAQHAIRLGVTEFLTKPCDLGELERAIDKARRQLKDSTTPPAPQPESAPLNTRDTSNTTPLADLEREAIIAALRAHNNNRSATARALGLSRRALYNKLLTYRTAGHNI